MPTLREFLSYNPAELSFGTSGLRGLVSHMTDLECYINAAGFLEFLVETGVVPGAEIYIAGDLRDSTPRILTTMMAAISDSGFKPVYLGLIPTPALAYYALENSAPCIMVTGSHIPADRNGIKFYKTGGEVLKADEKSIKRNVTQKRRDIYESDSQGSKFTSEGMLVDMPILPAVEPDARTAFFERYSKFLGQPLSGKHIIAYQHSAVGRDLLCGALEELGAKVTAVGRSDVFIPIDTENVTKENRAYFRALANQYPGNFAIVSTDGDSDRPFVVDEKGEFYRGDVLGCVVAEELGADFAALPISANDAADTFCKDKNIELAHTKIGSPYVISAMQEAEKQYSRVTGWEVNGGFLTSSSIDFAGVTLNKLPTRDAFLPIFVVLVAAAKSGQSLSGLFGKLPKRYTGGGLIDDIPLDKIAHFKELCGNEQIIKVIKQTFNGTPLGVAERVDLTDGLRLIFESGEVIHLRPSGNAPQFRVYTNADSQERADELSEEAIKTDGYIEKLLAFL